MKQSYQVSIGNVFFYTGLMFLSNYIALCVDYAVSNILFVPLLGEVNYTLLTICVFATCILIGLGVPLLATFLFFKSVVVKQYVPSKDRFFWLKSCVRLILPAETIRFIFCLKSLGHLNQSGVFSLVPTFLFENTYLHWTNRHYEVREWLEYTANDFLAYAACYIVYIAVYLALVAILYKHFWKKAQKECEDPIIQ